MSVRLIITMYTKPGKGTELAQAMADRCRAVQQEPGCQQFEVFQSALDPDTLVVLELWADQTALDVHAQVNATQPPNRRWPPSTPMAPAPEKTIRITARGSPVGDGPARPPLDRRQWACTGCSSQS